MARLKSWLGLRLCFTFVACLRCCCCCNWTPPLNDNRRQSKCQLIVRRDSCVSAELCADSRTSCRVAAKLLPPSGYATATATSICSICNSKCILYLHLDLHLPLHLQLHRNRYCQLLIRKTKDSACVHWIDQLICMLYTIRNDMICTICWCLSIAACWCHT